MSNGFPSWERIHFEPGGAPPMVFYAAFGEFGDALPLTREYRSDGLPEGVEITTYEREESPDVFESFLDGHFGRFLAAQLPDQEAAVRDAPECMVLIGGIHQADTLDYLRDTVGLLTCALDHGAVGLLDVQALRWWNRPDWRTTIFEPAAPVPVRHVVTLISETTEPGLNESFWLHTHGLRKFGRADLSIHDVKRNELTTVTQLFNQLIEQLALGAILPDGQELEMIGLPKLTCWYGGGYDDPVFNNLHVELNWPDGYI